MPRKLRKDTMATYSMSPVIHSFIAQRWKTIVKEVANTGFAHQLPGMVKDVFDSPFAKDLYKVAAAAHQELKSTKANKEDIARICQEILVDLWLRPGMQGRLVIPTEFWESQVGFMILTAQMWAEDDELISPVDASELSGKSLSTLNRMASSGRIIQYLDPHEPNPQHRTRFSKNDILNSLVSETNYQDDTPWGKQEYDEDALMEGVSQVTTSSHGGVKISLDFALKEMSDAAIDRGMLYNGFLYYEEDDLWAVAVYDLKKYWPLMIEKQWPFPCNNPEDLQASVLRTLKSGNIDYLIEMGYQPTEDEINLLRLDSDTTAWEREEVTDYVFFDDFILGEVDDYKDRAPEGTIPIRIANSNMIYFVDTQSMKNNPIFLSQCEIVGQVEMEISGHPFLPSDKLDLPSR